MKVVDSSSKTDKKRKRVAKTVDPLFDPSCCTYKLNGDIRNYVQELIDGKKDGQVDEKAQTILRDLMDQEEANKGTMSYDSLSELHRFMQRADKNYLDPFYMLLEECKCIRPEQRENKQLETRLKRLRLRCSQQMYDKMASSVDRVVENKTNTSLVNGGDTQKEARLLNGSVMAVINSFLVFICTFIFCYKALEYSLAEPHIVGQVLFGLLGSTIVACAELYFLIRVI